MWQRICLFLALCILIAHTSPSSATASDLEPDSIDPEYWEMVQGFLDQGQKGTAHLLFENVVTCNVCHAMVAHLRPFIEQKTPDSVIVQTMKKSYCRPENLKKIEEIEQAELQAKDKFELKKKICRRVIKENLVDILTTMAVTDGEDSSNSEYICEHTYPPLCPTWLRGIRNSKAQ